MLAELTSNDAAVIIAACAALFVAVITPLLKFIIEIRKQTTETNTAVSTCKGHSRTKDDPTLRELVEKIGDRLEALEDKTLERHEMNTRRIERVTTAVDAQSRKMDRVMNAIGGINDRIDRLEGGNQ